MAQHYTGLLLKSFVLLMWCGCCGGGWGVHNCSKSFGIRFICKAALQLYACRTLFVCNKFFPHRFLCDFCGFAWNLETFFRLIFAKVFGGWWMGIPLTSCVSLTQVCCVFFITIITINLCQCQWCLRVTSWKGYVDGGRYRRRISCLFML